MGPTAFPGMAQTAQVSVVAISISPLTQDSPHAEAVVLRLLQLQGQLFAFKKQIPLEDGTFRAIAEFCDQAAASTAVVNCGNALVDVGPQPTPCIVGSCSRSLLHRGSTSRSAAGVRRLSLPPMMV